MDNLGGVDVLRYFLFLFGGGEDDHGCFSWFFREWGGGVKQFQAFREACTTMSHKI